MDTLCVGFSVFELGAMFHPLIGYAEIHHQDAREFLGVGFENAEKFWNMVLKMYLGTEDEAVCRSVAKKAMIIGYTRMLRRPEAADSPAKIARCKEMLTELLNKVDSLVF